MKIRLVDLGLSCEKKEYSPKELAPCSICGHKEFHIRPYKTTVSCPVSIECRLCRFTVEMQSWQALEKWWNTRTAENEKSVLLIDEEKLAILIGDSEYFDIGFTEKLAKELSQNAKSFMSIQKE